ncbi:hypothetical protein [Pseudescherichia sp. L3]|uniref:hypothetical protein n=1 Tax=Pseudescherichia sp. L3 TaxID=2970817 RepID=UPI00214F935A|nr:hypothetical protein [Pseudescherichia sp. L3]MCR4457032.1 hypothetical protein [Pseudescherichia sp. L3]
MEWYNYTGNAADWVMAGAALGGYFLARDYFSDIIKKDGYDLVKKLHLELLPQLQSNLNLSSINVLDIEVPSYIAGENGVFQDEDEESNLNVTLNRDLKDLKQRLSTSYKLEREILAILNDLEIYGWHLKNDRKQILIELLNAHKATFSRIHNITLYLEEILKRNPPQFEVLEENDGRFGSKYLPPFLQPIDDLSANLIKNQKALYDVGSETPYTFSNTLWYKYFNKGKHLKLYYEYRK